MEFARRVPWSLVLLALFAVAVVANMVLSDRPLLRSYTMLQIDEIATLPPTPDLADVRRYTEIGAGELGHSRGLRQPLDIEDQPLRLGWVYQESGILNLPFWAENVSTGPTLYIDTGYGYRIAGVAPGRIDLLERKVGRPVVRDYRFRWYLHVWGWAAVLSLALLIWLWRKEAGTREEASWAAELPEAA
jgi:hypothetical protein